MRRLELCVAGLLVGLAVQAQTGPAPGTATAPSAPYADRVIEGLQPLPSSDELAGYDSSGWPRYLRVDARVGTEPFDERRRTRGGVGVQALLETPNHGTLSLEGTTLTDEKSGSFTLRQRGLPLGGGWLGHHDLGVIDRPTPGIAQLPSRVFVPSSVMLGAAGQWEQPEQGWLLQAAGGEPGRLQALPSSAFTRLPGRRSMLGLQSTPRADPNAPTARGWSSALLLEQAEAVAPQGDVSSGARVDAQSALMVLRRDDADSRLQAHLVQSHSQPTGLAASQAAGTRQGAWLDAEFDEGPRRHAFGAYRLDTGLTWADQPLPEDLQGVYYRASWRTRQWSLEGSVDALQSLSGRAHDGLFATAAVRWRLHRDHSVGAGFSVRRFAGDASSAYGDWRWQNGWGATGLRLELAQGQDTPRTERLSWDQEWTLPLGSALSSSLGLAREGAVASTGREARQLWSAALNGSLPIGPRANLRGNINAEQGNDASRTLGMNLGAQWRMAPQWSLDGQFTRTVGRSLPGISLDPLAPRGNAVVNTASRSFLVVLRYDLQAGSRSLPLGGRALQGGGGVRGIVYFDANRSGTQEASEGGVPGVTVVLDQRYTVRTDAQGRFEFPFVAAGTHTLTLRSDTLPLPWTAVNEAGLKIEVSLRGNTEVGLPVQRAP